MVRATEWGVDESVDGELDYWVGMLLFRQFSVVNSAAVVA